MKDWFERWIERIANRLAHSTHWEKNSQEYQSMKYGLDALLRNAIGVLLLMLAAFALQIPLQCAVFLLIFGFLRSASFGVHANSIWLCTLLSFVRTLGGVYLALFLKNHAPVWVLIAMSILSLTLFWRYAPAETTKRPIPPKQRKRFTEKSRFYIVLVVIQVWELQGFGQREYAFIVAMAMLLQSINLCPVMYRIFEKPRAYEI